MFSISRSSDLVNTLPVISTWNRKYSLELCSSCLCLFLCVQHCLLKYWTLLFVCSVHAQHQCTMDITSNLSRGKLCQTDKYFFIEAIPLCDNISNIYIYIYIYIYIFPSYTTINIKINTITCFKLMATCFGRPCDHHQANFTDRVPSMRVQYGIP